MQLSARSPVAALAVAAAIATACGNIGDFGGSSGFGGATATGGSSGGGSTGSGPMVSDVCPEKAPTSGSACTNTRVTCEYGSGSDPDCNTLAICTFNGRWEIRKPTGCPSGCPSRFDQRRPGTTCSETEVCTYFEATCGCAGATAPYAGDGGDDASAPDADVDAGPTTGQWQCVRPEDGCPARRPIPGAACTQKMTCDYGSCLFSRPLAYWCSGVEWEAAFAPECP